MLYCFSSVSLSRITLRCTIRPAKKIIKSGELSSVTSADKIDKYLAKGVDTMTLVCYTLDSMIREGRSQEEIKSLLVTQTAAVSNTTSENSTGVYGYINGEYLDGTDWEPDEDYVPIDRPWYVDARANFGRVAEYSKRISKRFGYSEKQQDEIYMMGLLHDVGKIGIPDAVINKPGKLTDEEYDIIKTHPVIGSQILSKAKGMSALAIGARWHHERYDGNGYPDGLAGEKIDEQARIIAVADAYDAMTSRRSYRDILPQEKVRKEIEDDKGTQFDPTFADIMLQMIDEDTDYNMHDK